MQGERCPARHIQRVPMRIELISRVESCEVDGRFRSSPMACTTLRLDRLALSGSREFWVSRASWIGSAQASIGAMAKTATLKLFMLGSPLRQCGG